MKDFVIIINMNVNSDMYAYILAVWTGFPLDHIYKYVNILKHQDNNKFFTHILDNIKVLI